MSKLTIGVVAGGAVLATAAALSLFVGNGTGTSGHEIALQAAASGTPTSSPAVGRAGVAGKSAVQLVSSATKAQAVAKVPVVKVVRSVTLVLPITKNDVGANVTGSIQVFDTAGKSVTAVDGAAVALQQKRGKTFVTVSDGLTDANGLFAVSFTSSVNTVWRAELTAETGAKKESKTVATTASASVNWAARPDMDVAHGAASSYAFRINQPTGGTLVLAASAAVVKAHLEIANSKSPKKWIALTGVTVPATGIVTQSEKFPTAGTWLLRGATSANASNGAGYTTVLTITVS